MTSTTTAASRAGSDADDDVGAFRLSRTCATGEKGRGEGARGKRSGAAGLTSTCPPMAGRARS